MDAGLLRNRVTIEQQSATQDETGQPINSWSTLATVWAHIVHTKGVEMVKEGLMIDKQRASIRVRFRTDINTSMRVVAGSTIYQIKGISPDVVGREYVDLACEAY